MLYYFRSTKSQIFTKLKKTVGKQALFYLTSTDTKCFKRCSVSFPTSENTETTASLPRDIRLIFTDNPKMKHRSGSEAQSFLNNSWSSFLHLVSEEWVCQDRWEKNQSKRKRDRHRAPGGGKSPQYSLSCAIKAALSKAP